MSKKKHYVIFNEKSALIKTNEDIRIWQKETAMDAIDFKRSNGIVKKASKTVDDCSIKYDFCIDDYILKVKFFNSSLDVNKEYLDRIQSLYEIDRKKMKSRLKYISIIVALAFSSGVLLSKPVKEFVEEFQIEDEFDLEEDKQLIK